MNRATGNDPRDAWMAAALRSQSEHAHPQSDCPRPERIWDAVRLHASLDERLEIIDHLSECPACAEAWSLAAQLAAAQNQTAHAEVNASQQSELASPVSPPSRAFYGGHAWLIGAAAVILLAAGIAFIMLRSPGQPGVASIKSPLPVRPTAEQTKSPVPGPAAVRPRLPASELPAVTETPATVPPSQASDVAEALRPRATQKALTADERAIRDLIAAYQRLIATRDLVRLRAIQPGITSVELEALQRETPVLDSQSGLSINLQSVRVDGRTATARFSLRYTVLIEGQRQVRTTNQVMRFEKTATESWIVVGTTPDTSLSSPVESDDAAIRRLIAAYEQVIEAKDLSRLRAISPSTTPAQFDALQTRLRPLLAPRQEPRLEDLQDVGIEVFAFRFEGRTAEAAIQVAVKWARSRMTYLYGQILTFEKTDAGSWSLTGIREGMLDKFNPSWPR